MYFDARLNQLKLQASEFILSKLQGQGYNLVYSIDGIFDSVKQSELKVKLNDYVDIEQKVLDTYYQSGLIAESICKYNLEETGKAQQTCLLARRLKIRDAALVNKL